jgi:prevent-host-death family protein
MEVLTMKTVSLADAKAKLSEVVNSAEYKHERIVIEKRNKPVAVVIGYEEYKKLETLEDMYESKLLEESLKRGDFVSLDEAAKRLSIEL